MKFFHLRSVRTQPDGQTPFMKQPPVKAAAVAVQALAVEATACEQIGTIVSGTDSPTVATTPSTSRRYRSTPIRITPACWPLRTSTGRLVDGADTALLLCLQLA
jgi:hypothetical protein